MKKDGINLLINKVQAPEQKKFLEKLKKTISYAIFIYFLTTVFLFMASFYLFQTEKKIYQDIAMLEGQINSLAKIEGLKIALKERIGKINELLKRNDFAQVLTNIQKIVPEGTGIETLNIKCNKVSLTGSVATLEQLENLLSNVRNLSKEYPYLSFGPLAWQKEKGYSFSLEAKYSENNEKL